MKRKIAAILASDVAGYSRLVAEDEEGTLARLEAYRAVFAEFVQKSGGRIFNTAGDAILAEFPSAVEATRCAIDIQESLRTRNSGYLPSKQMLFRIGITIGDVVERENGDLLGDGVNIAARLEGLAEPGGICVSRNIYEQVANKVSVPFSDIGENEVKNMPQPVHAFRIELPGGERAAAPVPFAPAGAAARAQGRAKVRIQDRGAAGGGLGLAMALGGLVLAAGAGALGVWVWTGRAPAPAIQGELKPISPPVPLPPPVPPVAETLKPSAPEPAAPPQHASKPEPAAKPESVNPGQPRPGTVKPEAAKPELAKPEPAKPEPAKPQLAAPKPAAPPPAAAVPAEGELSPAERQATGAPAPAEPQVTPQPSPRIAGVEPQTPKPPAPAAPPVAPQPSAPPAPKIAIPPGTPPAQIYALIAKSGGIVPDAATAPELYHNARTHESRGEITQARAAYLKLAALAEDLIDPQLRFAAFLRTQDGPQGAQAVFEKLAEGGKNRAAALILALQGDEAQKRKQLTQFIASHPDFAPAQYLLAEEFGGERAGGQTIGERRQQFAALQSFIAAHDGRRLTSFFLDQSMLGEWIDKARSRHRTLEHFLKTAKLDPVAQFIRSNTGWMVNVSLPEPATRIFWRIGEREEFKPTGELRSIDQRTGKPMPNPSFEMPGATPRVRLFLRYEDALGQPQGPFPIDFEPQSELVRGQRDLLQRFSSNWISFNAGGNANKLLYFTYLVNYRCAIAGVELLFDDSPLAMQLRLPPCDPADPHRIPSGARVFMPMPASAKKVTVTVRFADGGQPEKRTFEAR